MSAKTLVVAASLVYLATVSDLSSRCSDTVDERVTDTVCRSTGMRGDYIICATAVCIMRHYGVTMSRRISHGNRREHSHVHTAASHRNRRLIDLQLRATALCGI